MGDRISIQFENGNDKSVVLFSHWGGMGFLEQAQDYTKALVKWSKKTAGVSGPLSRLEPQTVMVDFVRHITKDMKLVDGDLYFGFDQEDGDNSDNGHHVIDLCKVEKKVVIKEFEEMKDAAELRALSTESLRRPLTDKEFDRMKELSKLVYPEKTK